MIFLEAVSRVPEERRTLFRTLYNTELCTHFLSDETSALPTERPLKTKKKNLANFCSINRSFFSFGCRFYSKLETKMWLGLLKTSGSLTTISINQLNQFCQLNRRLSDEEPSENTEPLCVCVCVLALRQPITYHFFFLTMNRDRTYRTGAGTAASSPAATAGRRSCSRRRRRLDRLGQRQTVVNEDDVHDEQDAEPAEDQHHQDDAGQHHVGRHDVLHQKFRVRL